MYITGILVYEGAFSPRDPIGPPLLTPVTNTERAGLFAVDLSDASPQPGEESVSGDSPTQPEVLAVAFLFRIEERSSQNISYIWMVRKCLLCADLCTCSLCSLFDIKKCRIWLANLSFCVLTLRGRAREERVSRTSQFK